MPLKIAVIHFNCQHSPNVQRGKKRIDVVKASEESEGKRENEKKSIRLKIAVKYLIALIEFSKQILLTWCGKFTLEEWRRAKKK